MDGGHAGRGHVRPKLSRDRTDVPVGGQGTEHRTWRHPLGSPGNRERLRLGRCTARGNGLRAQLHVLELNGLST